MKIKVLLKKENDSLPGSRVLGIVLPTWISTNILGTVLTAMLYGYDPDFFWIFLAVALVFTSPTILFAIPAIYFLNRIIERKYRVAFAPLFILTLCGSVIIFIAAMLGSFSEALDILVFITPFIAAAEVSFFIYAGRIILKKTDYAEAL